VFLYVVKWLPTLDTSPRDYVVTVTFTDQLSGNTYTASGMLTVPKADSGDGGCVADGNGSPVGAIVLALGGMAAILPRLRRRLLRAKA
jgi:hypothetical protein